MADLSETGKLTSIAMPKWRATCWFRAQSTPSCGVRLKATIVSVEEWTYDFGPQRFLRIFTFRNGRLASDETTEDFYHGGRSVRAKRIPPDIREPALRKLDWLDHARSLQDLRMPPSNHLEALKGKPHGFHSIRISERWRIVFRCDEGDAFDVRIVDYH
ncbi:MAG: type II toxin-antitoxin system RelE/ParE family toxin [Pseudomonadota bacterium]